MKVVEHIKKMIEEARLFAETLDVANRVYLTIGSVYLFLLGGLVSYEVAHFSIAASYMWLGIKH